MKFTRVLFCCLLTAASHATAATFDFEDVPLGTGFGSAAGDSPGDVVLTRWDVAMSVESFTTGGPVAFNRAEVVAPPTSFFPAALNPTQVLQLNNISAGFDFSAVPGDVTRVTVDFVDLGGDENFDLNGSGLQIVSDLTGLAPVPGFSVNVLSPMAVLGGFVGTLEIVADPGFQIETLLLGGQEFAIDNVAKSVVPEPAAALLVSCGVLAMPLRRRG